MSYPSNNRQNYRMRANSVPPPTKNPYLSRQELRKKALEYNAGLQVTQDRTSDHRNNRMQPQTNNSNQRMAPSNMLQNINDNRADVLPPFPTEMIDMTPSQTTPATRNMNAVPQENRQTRQIMTPTENDWASPTTRSWMDSLRITPSQTMPEQSMEQRMIPRTNPVKNDRSSSLMNSQEDQWQSPSNSQNFDNSLDFLPHTDRENQEYLEMIRRHPEDVRRIYNAVQVAFDRLDYDGSWIYDENTDRTTLIRLSEDIYNSLLPLTEGYDPDAQTSDDFDEENRTPGILPNKNSVRWMFYVIFILVQNELLYRRRRKEKQNAM